MSRDDSRKSFYPSNAGLPGSKPCINMGICGSVARVEYQRSRALGFDSQPTKPMGHSRSLGQVLNPTLPLCVIVKIECTFRLPVRF